MKKNFLFGTLAVLLAGFWFGGASLATYSTDFEIMDWKDYHDPWDYGTYDVNVEGNTITYSNVVLQNLKIGGIPAEDGTTGGLVEVLYFAPEDSTGLTFSGDAWANWVAAGAASQTAEDPRFSVGDCYWVTPQNVKRALAAGAAEDGHYYLEWSFPIVTTNHGNKDYTVKINVDNVTLYSGDDTNNVWFKVVDGKVVVEDGKQVINSIEFANVVKPVAGNEATTGGITVTEGITIKDAVWTEKLPYKRPVSVPPVLTSVTSASTLQIASESTTTSEEFTGTFEEGKEYVLNLKYDYDDGYTGNSVTYKVNGADATDELEGDGDIASFKFTAEAKPAQSNMSGGGGGSRGGGSSNSNTSAKSDEKATDTAKADEQKADEAKADETKSEEAPAEGTVADAAPAPMTEAQAIAKFGQEQIAAYQWAHDKGITTMDTVEDARLDQPLTRAELAKMMVVYMSKVAKKSPVVTGTVNYPDVKVEEIGKELVGYIQLAYQFQIMGVDANGNPIEEFMPNALVTRGEYATVFSRVLFGSLFNQEGEDFYSKHIAALNAAGILTNTDPTIQEMRGWVMLMMYRSSQNLEEIAKVAAEIGATADEIQAGKKAAEILAEEEAKEAQEATTGDVAEAPVAEEQAQATTGDVAEAPAAQEQAEVATGDVAEVPAVEETASAEANTGDVAAEPSNN